ncbi:Retrovirus-related Pol polyprotein from transposon RE1 [Vitis vinifera]|uniref:Retrovirus-related Pol polyprotein from transposon RE1 n=1 Tax=Vitis vinifera TaxID=29760 RepID=A0A438DKH5_VITVI|nr:Retrovirus-related Pol polyprotein from transposon RE1 [Vitis vinifera]
MINSNTENNQVNLEHGQSSPPSSQNPGSTRTLGMEVSSSKRNECSSEKIEHGKLLIYVRRRRHWDASGFSQSSVSPMVALKDTKQVYFNWPLHQLDVKNAFLNGNLEEEVFMDLQPGFKEKLGKKKVIKLQGYIQSQVDHTMFYKHSREGKIVVLIVYVDDIILIGDDNPKLERLKKALTREFEIKDLGPLKYFLGLLECKGAKTPLEPNLKLQPTSPVEVIDKEKYQHLVGRLIYLSHTSPDIAFVSKKQNVVARSSAKAKFKAIAHGICEVLWIKQLLEEHKVSSPLPMKERFPVGIEGATPCLLGTWDCNYKHRT